MNDNQEIGKFGEKLAKNYLIKHGYKILASNVKTSYKEIDLIAQHRTTLVFVEVKTRSSKQFGSADEAMTWFKMNNFNRAIELFLARKNIETEDIRADLIAIDIDRTKRMAKLKHYRDIF